MFDKEYPHIFYVRVPGEERVAFDKVLSYAVAKAVCKFGLKARDVVGVRRDGKECQLTVNPFDVEDGQWRAAFRDKKKAENENKTSKEVLDEHGMTAAEGAKWDSEV